MPSFWSGDDADETGNAKADLEKERLAILSRLKEVEALVKLISVHHQARSPE
jgi:hypothetical protein